MRQAPACPKGHAGPMRLVRFLKGSLAQAVATVAAAPEDVRTPPLRIACYTPALRPCS